MTWLKIYVTSLGGISNGYLKYVITYLQKDIFMIMTKLVHKEFASIYLVI